MDRLSIQMNAVAIGSRKLSDAQKGSLDLPDSVHVTITTSDGETLVDEDVVRGEFSTGSVGYKLYVRDTEA